MPKKDPRGGAREGAGRKPDPNAKEPYGTRLSKDTIAFLQSIDNAAAYIDDTIKRSKGYRQWKARTK